MIAERSGRRLRRSIDFLGSGRLAVWVLAAVVALLLVYLLVPQRSRLPEQEFVAWVEASGWTGRACHALGATDVLGSRPFWALYGLLVVNLGVCMIRRTGAVRRLCRFPGRIPPPSAGWIERRIEAEGIGTEQVAARLRRRGYRVLAAQGSVYGLRGRLASLGHWMFHAALLALLLAGALLAAERDPFRARIGVGEGEAFDLDTARLMSANQPLPRELPPLRFAVDRVDLLLDEGGLERFEVILSTPEGTRLDASINRPYRSAPFQVLVHGFGYMAGWAIVNPRDRALAGAWVKLVPFPIEAEDSFPLRVGGVEEGTVHVRLDPDHDAQGSRGGSPGHELRDPRFRVRVVWRGREVFRGLLEPGERIGLEGGREFLFLPEIRKYALLDVIEERGHTVVFACLGAMILGLAIRYARLRKEILVDVGDRSLRVYGRAELLEDLFEEELERVVRELVRAPSGAREREA